MQHIAQVAFFMPSIASRSLPIYCLGTFFSPRLLGDFLLLCSLFSAQSLHAKDYIPTSTDAIVAEWQVLDNAISGKVVNSALLGTGKNSITQNSLADQATTATAEHDPTAIARVANAYLTRAALPGQSHFYDLAHITLEPLINANSADKTIWLAWAQVQQHQHHFSQAHAALVEVFKQDPLDTTALLLKSRLLLIADKPQDARQTCLRLFGQADLFTLTTCTLEATSYLGPESLSQSFKQLQVLAAQGLPNDARRLWIRQILADMATRSGQFSQALDYLQQDLTEATVAHWSQWADAALAVGQAQHLLDKLAPIVNANPDKDDPLVLRLALAEQQLDFNNHTWRALMAERVTLREQRGDNEHAADLAIYYLMINKDSQRALFWAQVNWQQAREPNDKRLLARAQLAAGTATSTAPITPSPVHLRDDL